MKESYYREKIISLVNKLFLDTGNAKCRMINCETKIEAAYWASTADGVPENVQNQWIDLWTMLNDKPEWITNNGLVRQSSLSATMDGKWNMSMEKYLHFFLEEFHRVI